MLACELVALPTYLPRYTDLRGRERLLFHNYVFVDCPEDRTFELFRLKGAVGPLMISGRAARSGASSAVAQLRARESKDGYITFNERFTHNEPVVVLEGPYKNKIVLYRGMDRDQRETALFSLLGRDVVKSFDRDQLAPLTIN